MGSTFAWFVYPTIMPSLCLYYVITGAPGYPKKTPDRGLKGMLLHYKLWNYKAGYFEMFYTGRRRLEFKLLEVRLFS